MKILKLVSFLALSTILTISSALADARVMNPGEAKGQFVYLSEQDVIGNSEKFRNLSPLSIPVFAELPMELSVVSGTITLKQQNLLSHVQIKSRARQTPNLDISNLEGGLQSELLKPYKDGDYVYMRLTAEGEIFLSPSTEQEALEFYNQKNSEEVKLVSDLSVKKIFRTSELSWQDFDKVGSKAANYAELARLLNSPARTVVRPGYGLPFFYYQQFIDSNPLIQKAIEKVLKDPLMKRVAKVSYREEKLKAIRDLIESDQSIINPDLINELLSIFEGEKTAAGKKARMKLRSSTNSEDLPNFNGAGLYSSEAYKPEKDGKEKNREKKEKSLKEALRIVWASVWNLRAYEERAFFRIPHDQVKMGMQINPTFANEGVDGVVVTKNVANRPELTGAGVYIEAQRGDKFSVANPEGGTRPEQILVLFDESQPLNPALYQINTIQKSNVGDDGETVLGSDNPNPIMSVEETKDLVLQCLKAREHFRPILGRDKKDFSLDLEFKVDSEDTGARQVYLKQSRPFID